MLCGNRLPDSGCLQPGLRVDDIAPRVDHAGDACIGAAYQPASCFYRSQAGIVLMLPVAGGIAPPAIIGDNGDQVGAVADIAGHELPVDAFIADGGCDPVAVIGGGEDG